MFFLSSACYELMGPKQKKQKIGLELSIKQKIHKEEMEKLISKQQREINEILVRGGVHIEETVHEAMVTCIAHIASFLMNKEWRRLMISSKKICRASEILDPAWTDFGRINWGLNFSDVVGFDPHPHGNNNTGNNNKHRSKFALRDDSNIYIIDGQFVETIEHQRVDFESSASNPFNVGLGNTICFSSKYIVTGGADKCIGMWFNQAPYRSHYKTAEVGIIHDVAITSDSMFLAVRWSRKKYTTNTLSVRNIGPGELGYVMNEIRYGSFLGPMVFSESTDEIVLTGYKQVKTISLIFWKYKCSSKECSSKEYRGEDHIRTVDYARYPCLDKSKHGVSSIYVSNSGTTMAIQYRSPDEIVVMKRNVDDKDRIDLVQVAKFDKYPNTFDRKILFSPSRYDDVIVFATDAAIYVASIKCNCNKSLPLCKECNRTTLPVAYKNRNNSHPLCILPDEKAMLVTNKDDRYDRSALIMSIPRVYRDFTKKIRQVAVKTKKIRQVAVEI